MTSQTAISPSHSRQLGRARWRNLNVQGLVFILVLALVWELLARTVFSVYDSIASTSQTLVAMVGLVNEGTLLAQIGHTLTVTVVGWAIAILVGGLLGVLLGLSDPVWKYSMASVEVLRSIPSISFVPVALLLLGFSQTMELVVVVYVCVWPVLMATMGGVRGVEPQLRDTARTLGLGWWLTVTRIVLPAAVPHILVGIRLALSLAIALAVIAEMLGNPQGLGFGIVFVQRAFRPADVFAYLLVIGLIGWLLNTLFTFLIRRVAPRFAGTL